MQRWACTKNRGVDFRSLFFSFNFFLLLFACFFLVSAFFVCCCYFFFCKLWEGELSLHTENFTPHKNTEKNPNIMKKNVSKFFNDSIFCCNSFVCSLNVVLLFESVLVSKITIYVLCVHSNRIYHVDYIMIPLSLSRFFSLSLSTVAMINAKPTK